jgi:hypothetical protein
MRSFVGQKHIGMIIERRLWKPLEPPAHPFTFTASVECIATAIDPSE